MARYYQNHKPWNPRYYNYGGLPTRFAFDWRGRTSAPQRSAAHLDLGNADINDSFYTGTHNEELQESFYDLPGQSPDVSHQVIDYLGRPGRGRPEPLSPQRYPLWQLDSMAQRSGLGLFETLSDTQKTIGLLAVGGVAAFFLLRRAESPTARSRRKRRKR